MNRSLFKLDSRLSLCASFVRPDITLIDVGTDHGYVPIWLVKNNIIKNALAVDINKGPLLRANENILRYNVQNQIKTQISDGLEAVLPKETADILIAGMGGELIAKILHKSPWIKSKNIHLILQPMTAAEHLRKYLYENGFYILQEKAVLCDKHIYSVISAVYNPTKAHTASPLAFYAGALKAENSDEILYLKRVIHRLEKQCIGFSHSGNQAEIEHTHEIIRQLQTLVQKGEELNDNC